MEKLSKNLKKNLLKYSKIEKSLESIQNKQTDIVEKYETFERYLRQKDPAFLEFLKRKEQNELL